VNVFLFCLEYFGDTNLGFIFLSEQAPVGLVIKFKTRWAFQANCASYLPCINERGICF